MAASVAWGGARHACKRAGTRIDACIVVALSSYTLLL